MSGNYRVPYYLRYTQLDTLPFVARKDPRSTSQTAIEAAGAKWTGISSAWGLVHDDTRSTYWDHGLGATDLAAGKLGVTTWFQHGDNHLLKDDTNFNNDPADVKWDYNADTTTGTPDTYDILKVAIHEFGHWVMYCKTYPGGDTQLGACSGYETSDSVMWSYVFDPAGSSYRNLFTHDRDSVLTIYGG